MMDTHTHLFERVGSTNLAKCRCQKVIYREYVSRSINNIVEQYTITDSTGDKVSDNALSNAE